MIFYGSQSAALALLKKKVASDVDPVLDETNDLLPILLQSKRADRYGVRPDDYTEWKASTVLALNAYAVPTTRNGHFYRVSAVTGDAKTGAIEPTWPTSGTIVDNHVTFQEAGATSWTPSWELDAACAEAVRMKLAAAANKDQYIMDGRGQASTFLFLNLQRMLEHFESRISSSAPVIKRGRYADYNLLV